MKKYLRMSSAAVAIGALRVKFFPFVKMKEMPIHDLRNDTGETERNKHQFSTRKFGYQEILCQTSYNKKTFFCFFIA